MASTTNKIGRRPLFTALYLNFYRKTFAEYIVGQRVDFPGFTRKFQLSNREKPFSIIQAASVWHSMLNLLPSITTLNQSFQTIT